MDPDYEANRDFIRTKTTTLASETEQSEVVKSWNNKRLYNVYNVGHCRKNSRAVIYDRRVNIGTKDDISEKIIFYINQLRLALKFR